METSQIMVAVGAVFVVPQVAGFAATRIARRASAVIWALAAAGTTAVLGAISAAYRGQGADLKPFPLGWFCFGIAAISILHLVVGAILGMLDLRARASRR